MIKAVGITKKYDNKTVLNSIDIEILPNEISVLIGPSGGGKSTIIKSVSLIEPPDSGSIEIDNHLFTFPQNNDKFKIWPNITVVFQKLFLWPHLTLKKNILLPLHENNIKPDLDYFEELINEFEVKNILSHYPNQSSVGQQQRIAIIRALMLKPKYLFLDEITSALDIEIGNKILDHLVKLKRMGVGILLVTHLLGFAKKMADKIYFIDNGVIIEHGDKIVITNPKQLRVKKFIENII